MAQAGDRGATLHGWTFSEYVQYERSRRWYAIAAVVTLLLFAYAFATRNFLFAVILVMSGLVLYLRHARAPQPQVCTITDRGVQIGERWYQYDTLQSFWVVDDADPGGTLYFHPRGLRTRIAVPIVDADTASVRTTLRAHLREEVDEDEPFTDAVARALKL